MERERIAGLLSSLASAGSSRARQQVSREIFEATKYLPYTPCLPDSNDAPDTPDLPLGPSQKSNDARMITREAELQRRCRELVGELGGVEQLCQLLLSGSGIPEERQADDDAEAEEVQHWCTLSQLCLSPKVAEGFARSAQALAAVKAILGGTATAPARESRLLRTAVTLTVANVAGFCSTATMRVLIAAEIVPLLINSAFPSSRRAYRHASQVQSRVDEGGAPPKNHNHRVDMSPFGIQNNCDQRDEYEWSVTALVGMARCREIQAQLLEEGVATTLGLILQKEAAKLGAEADRPSDMYLKACFGLVSLVGSEENDTYIARDLERCIRWMVRSLEVSLSGEAWPQSYKQTLW
jgi:hypothetical protein